MGFWCLELCLYVIISKVMMPTNESTVSHLSPTNGSGPLWCQENGGSWPPHPNTSWPEVDCQHGWSYDTEEFVNTLVTDLDLVCTNQWWPSTSTALFYVGSLIGNILFGQIADRFVLDMKGAEGRFND